jgi:hypothetical protein
VFRKRPPTPQPPPTPPSPRAPITEKTDFPSGLAVRTERGVFFIKGKTRFRFYSDRVVESWGLPVIEATHSAIKHLQPSPAPLGFRDGTLINNVADGKMYLISGNKKRHIVSPDAFTRYGLEISAALLVSDEEASLHSDGEVLK